MNARNARKTAMTIANPFTFSHITWRGDCCAKGRALPARPFCTSFDTELPPDQSLRCLLTSFVMSNIDTCFFPLNTAFRLSSALIMRRSLGSCRLFFLMYTHSFLVISVRGIGLLPTTAASSGEGVIAFMKAAFGLRAAAFFLAGAFLAGAFLAAAFLAGAFFADDFLAVLFFFAGIQSPVSAEIPDGEQAIS